MKFCRGDGEVAGVGEREHEGARLIVGAVVVRRDPADESGFGLVRNDLNPTALQRSSDRSTSGFAGPKRLRRARALSPGVAANAPF